MKIAFIGLVLCMSVAVQSSTASVSAQVASKGKKIPNEPRAAAQAQERREKVEGLLMAR